MAKKRPQPSPGTPPSVTREEGIELLRQLISHGSKLLEAGPITSQVRDTWDNRVRTFLSEIYGVTDPHVIDALDIDSFRFLHARAEEEWQELRAQRVKHQLALLGDYVEQLETMVALGRGTNAELPVGSGESSRRVFLVHGHNRGFREEVARFVERLGLEVIVLHELPDGGRTIIEKFVASSDVAFAVVLMTADDRGGVITAPIETYSPRARQNVVLELGFFLGKLGRQRVVALHEQGVDIPSDYQGVLFIPLDERGAWKLGLARELRHAGLSVDLNLADVPPILSSVFV